MDKHFRKTSITPRANARYLRNPPLTPLTYLPPPLAGRGGGEYVERWPIRKRWYNPRGWYHVICYPR